VGLILPLHRPLGRLASALEAPLAGYPDVELVLVMVVAPILLNIGFFWVVDNLVMRHAPRPPADGDPAVANGGWSLGSQTLSTSLMTDGGSSSVAGAGGSDAADSAARGPRIWCLPVPGGDSTRLSTTPYAGPLAAGEPLARPLAV